MNNKNQKIKSIISLILAVCVVSGIAPTISYAAQSNEYVDPADRWVEANGRTNEFDINATTTYETQYCPVWRYGNNSAYISGAGIYEIRKYSAEQRDNVFRRNMY